MAKVMGAQVWLRESPTTLLAGLGFLTFIGSVAYGEYMAISAFLDFRVDQAGDFRWSMGDPSEVLWAGIFLIYMLFSPLISIVFAWPGYMFSIIAYALSDRCVKQVIRNT